MWKWKKETKHRYLFSPSDYKWENELWVLYEPETRFDNAYAEFYIHPIGRIASQVIKVEGGDKAARKWVEDNYQRIFREYIASIKEICSGVEEATT